MAVVAKAERRMISARTKAALAAAKARGVKMGGFRGVLPTDQDRARSAEVVKAKADSRAADLAPILEDIRAGGATSLREIAGELNHRGIPTARGGSWSAVQVNRVLARTAGGVAWNAAPGTTRGMAPLTCVVGFDPGTQPHQH
ncbi:recombinase family protein [Methylobacterium sp. WSM2598]|uniref:recombinase family protein n=1 Tax=Methylobacterium sp. WSM2598 TaxID=398261 RepID=UPI00036DC500|nr:recombinase family protein [Methylobacterium sp. WSM2598]